MKVALIGAGPSAFGALARLVALKQAGERLEITVFSTGDVDQENQISTAYKSAHTDQDINAALVADTTAGIMPARRFFDRAVQDHRGDTVKTGIKVSSTFGGLGNYWSGSVFPVHALHDPLTAILGDLSAHYRFIGERMPVAGQVDDALAAFFDPGSINHPPIDIATGLEKLTIRTDGFALGRNRFALNSHAHESHGCTQCGDCLYGCPRDALFRAANPIAAFAAAGQCRIAYEKVFTVNSVAGKVQIKTAGQTHTFDRAFVCTGALGTVELLGRSYPAPDKPVYIFDNLLWYFPVFSLMPQRTRLKSKAFGFAELAGGVFNHADHSYNHVLISTLPQAVFDKRFGRSGFSKALTGLLSRHLIIGAMYGSHEQYARYRSEQRGDGWQAVDRETSTDTIDLRQFSVLQQHLARCGWRTSAKLAQANDTSGHYTANLGSAYGLKGLAKTGAFDDNLFVCDSSTWNSASMSQQHTFTIMANASKIVQAAFS